MSKIDSGKCRLLFDGIQIIGAYVASVSKLPHEKELLFNKEQPFVIQHAEYYPNRVNNQWEIWVQAIV